MGRRKLTVTSIARWCPPLPIAATGPENLGGFTSTGSTGATFKHSVAPFTNLCYSASQKLAVKGEETLRLRWVRIREYGLKIIEIKKYVIHTVVIFNPETCTNTNGAHQGAATLR